MIPKSVQRFSEKIMLNKKLERDDDSTKSHPALANELEIREDCNEQAQSAPSAFDRVAGRRDVRLVGAGVGRSGETGSEKSHAGGNRDPAGRLPGQFRLA